MPTLFSGNFSYNASPPNVRMVLTSADASMDLNKLADMADKVMEVAMPTISAITDTHTDTADIKQL